MFNKYTSDINTPTENLIDFRLHIRCGVELDISLSYYSKPANHLPVPRTNLTKLSLLMATVLI